MSKILEWFMSKYTIIGLIVLIVSGLVFNFGYQKGRGDIVIVYDTTQVVDTIIQTLVNYTPAKPDTIYINTTKYHTYFSEYKMSREGFVKVWFIDSLEFFKWKVKEPRPIILTKHSYIKVPIIDYKTTIIIGVISFVLGGLTGYLTK